MRITSNPRVAHSDEPRAAPDRTGEKQLVSIVIPCFNNEAYVAEAIDSALGQTYANIEVIVIDDGSTDASLDIIRSYADRITWRTGPNQGACSARNWGLELAAGEFVKFLDADDLLTADCVGSQVFISSTSESERDVTIGEHRLIDASGNQLSGRQYVHSLLTGETFGFDELYRHGPLTTEPLHRRSLLLELGGFRTDVQRGQEHELHLRMFFHGIVFRYAPVLCYYYRIHKSVIRLSNAQRGRGHLFKAGAVLEVVNALKERDGMVPHATRKLMAQRAWLNARDLLRDGQAAQAEELFRAAREIYPEDPIVGSVFYKWICLLLGPLRAEEMGSVARPFRRAK